MSPRNPKEEKPNDSKDIDMLRNFFFGDDSPKEECTYIIKALEPGK